jgi:hypothetical protein
VLIDHVEQLQDPTVLGLVELVVQRPHMIRVLGRQPIRRAGGGAQPLALAAPRGHAQAFLAPPPLDGLAGSPPSPAGEAGRGRVGSPSGDGLG